MKIIGIGASEGIYAGQIYKYEPKVIEVVKHSISNISTEIKKLDQSIKQSIKDLEIIKEKSVTHLDSETCQIFDAHIEILNDPELYNAVVEIIKYKKVNVDYAFDIVIKKYIKMFQAMDNEYFQERAADIKDISTRMLHHLLGIRMCSLNDIKEEVIVVAKDLTPSDTAQLNPKLVKGFITDRGGRTSHSAIMARTLQIPAVVGTKNAFESIHQEDRVIINGILGEIIINPTNDQLREYNVSKKSFEEEQSLWDRFRGKKSITKDGHTMQLAANIGNSKDIERAIYYSCEGIGLFRSEFLYMDRLSLPSEDEQFEAYSTVLKAMPNQPVIIRTLDIGGDKELTYLPMEHEMNPFLGNRALRLCLRETEIFITQLRALLKASIYGNLHIMFPMIGTIEELDKALALVEDTKSELVNEGIEVSRDFKLGMMIEIPSAAMLARDFAKRVDFFSVGTNDLIQYTFAADRMNEKVAYLYQPYNPGLLRLLKLIVDSAHKEGIWVGMCGEMAGDVSGLALLVGLGFDELSMSASSILRTRYELSKIDYSKVKQLVHRALDCSYEKEVLKLIDEFMKGIK